MAPDNAFLWSNLGVLEEQLYRFAEAESCFRRGLNAAKNDDQKGNLFMNWACALVNSGNWEPAEIMARRAMKYKPESPKAQANLGIACLALRNWREGWKLYDAVIGFDQSRRKVQYQDESEWDGSPDRRIVIYGEQGLGDEISFASMIPDAARISKSVVVDCTDRLAGLFRRSFPNCTVYGTRWENGLGWDKKDAEIDASISVGALGKHFRLKDESFPLEPYIVPDPDRVSMWRALFARESRPVIGLAWTGGVAWTGDRYRKISLEQLLPLFRGVNATWVSLQYKDAGKEIAAFKSQHPDIDLRQYSYGTLTQDYDDTAALVAALNLTVAPPTSVVHLAGAMGAPCVAMHSAHDCWKFAGGLMFHRQNMTLVPHDKTWDGTIARAIPVIAGKL
jgi:tetratricopeptide (TPR) repeat protein